MKIILNGQEHEVEKEILTYEDVVTLVYGKPVSIVVSITYRRAATPKEDGILSFRQSVPIKEGTVFNAYVTSNA